MNSRKELLIPIGITFIFCLLSLYLNHQEGSTLVQTDEIWENRIAFYQEHYPFSVRVFTNYSIAFVHEVFGLKYLTAYIVVQYTLMYLLGLTFYFFLRALKFSIMSSCLGLVILMVSYPVLCAFIIPNYTWDDFWQYIAIVLAFWLVLRNRPIWASIVFAIGALAREPILLFYPIFLYSAICNNKMNKKELFITAAVPLVIYGFYAAFTFQAPESVRFHNFNKNFHDPAWAKNTVFSFIISFGFVWVTAYAAIATLGSEIMKNTRTNFILLGAALTVPLLCAATLALSLARETRIFFPPFVFLIPLTLWVLEKYRTEFKQYYSSFFGIPGLITIYLSYRFGVYAARGLFPQFDFRGALEFTQLYFGLHIAVALSFLAPLALALVRKAYTTQNNLPARS